MLYLLHGRCGVGIIQNHWNGNLTSIPGKSTENLNISPLDWHLSHLKRKTKTPLRSLKIWKFHREHFPSNDPPTLGKLICCHSKCLWKHQQDPHTTIKSWHVLNHTANYQMFVLQLLYNSLCKNTPPELHSPTGNSQFWKFAIVVTIMYHFPNQNSEVFLDIVQSI